MSLTTSQSRTIEFHPAFSSAQRRIAQTNKYESQFILSIYLPTKATATLKTHSLDLRLFYEIGHDELDTYTSRTILIEYDKRTKRIFHLKASFGESSFRMLTKRISDIKAAISALEKSVSPDTQKSYHLIKALVDTLFESLKKQQVDIEKDLFNVAPSTS